MKYIVVITLIVAAMLMAGSSYAGPIPGSSNELINGDFETGNWSPWEHGGGLLMGIAGEGHDWAVYCKDPTQSLLLRQVVDQSTNPLWDPNGSFSIINLTTDIRDVWAEGDPGHPASGISFRLDWYGPSATGGPVGNPTYSDWVSYKFTQDNTWQTVNPFEGFTPTWDGRAFQPRFVSVEILIDQAPGETVWIDNAVLTSKCVPEPMSIMLGVMGLGSVVGLRRVFRKK